MAWMPNRDALCLPGFDPPDGSGPDRHLGDISATRSTGVLNHGHRVEIDNSGTQLAIFGGRGWCFIVWGGAPRWVVERPMLDLPLPSLHKYAADVVVAAGVGFE